MIGRYIIALVVVALFSGLFVSFGTISLAKSAALQAKEGYKYIISGCHTDSEKELLARSTSFVMLKYSVKILSRSILALTMAIFPVLLLDYFKLLNASEVMSLAATPAFIIVSSLIIIVCAMTYSACNAWWRRLP